MQLTGEHKLPAPRERVWQALLDADTLRAAVPGCEAIESLGPGRFAITVVASVGPVRARFKGRLQQQDLQPPQRYTLSFEGDGGLAGFAKGSAEVELAESPGEGQAGGADAAAWTLLTYRAQAQVGGRMAQIGSRLIDATAAKLSADFFQRLARAVAPAGAPAAEPAAAEAPAGGTAAVALTAPAAAPAGTSTGQVSIQMPAWVWVYTVTALVLLVAWIAAH
jgi:uncharacterized protein